MTLRLCTAALVLLVAGALHAAEVRDYTYFLNELINLDDLPLTQAGVISAQASSYDRASKYDAEKDEYIAWDANGDWGKYIRVNEETKEGVMAELEGPGCIFRIWSANPQGVIRFYLDGAAEPTYEFGFEKLFTGEIEPFVRPFVWQRKVVLGGDNPASDCYLPIPFAKSCTVTSVIFDENGEPKDTPRHYYHIGYKLYPKEWQVETFSLPLKPAYKAALEETARIWSNCGLDPQPTRRARRQASTFRIEPGKTETIFDLSGPATIRQFFVKTESQDPYATRNAVLRAFWDGEQSPSVLTPLGDFFGRVVGTAEYKSLPLGMTDDADYCYWRMPFRERGTLTVENQGTELITLRVRFAYTTGAVPDNACYFHAKWRREAPSSTFEYPFVECDGAAGIFVGDLLAIDNLLGGWWGEGDEKFYVDGEKFPSTFGTGSEDYYGDAWGIRWFVNPYHGCPQNVDRKQVVYRWHISDSVPFAESFKATIENYSAVYNAGTLNGYASVAYWYQMPGGTDFFAEQLPPPDERLPSPKVITLGSLEFEDLLGEHAEADIIDKVETRDMYSAGKAVASEGAALKLVIPVETSDVYSIALFEAPDKPLGAGWTLLYDGKPVGKKLFLTEGEHTFTLQRDPKQTGAVTLDYIIIEPYRNFITDWLVVGPFDNAEGAGYDKPYAPEGELDLGAEYDVVEGKAKWTKLAAEPNGFVDLNEHFDPSDWVVGYACVEVVSPAELDTDMLVGSDDGIKIWLNGTLVHDAHELRGWTPDEDRVAVHLKEGTNTVLLKISEQGGAWGFSARFVDPEEVLQYRLPTETAE